jgi:ribosomal protein L16 Arg81 hydroxylase
VRPDALRRLVGTEDFATAYWGRRPLLRNGCGFDDLLDPDGVDDLLADRGLRTPFIRVVRDGRVQPASAFTGGGGLGAEVADQVRDDLVMHLLDEGATVVLQGLHRIWPPLREFCADLAASLGCAVQANAYLTPGGNTGFAAHYDTHDVFVLQVAGTKHWQVHEPVLADPLEQQPWGGRASEVAAQAVGEAYLDHVMSPGDLLYLPRGWLHAASALDDTSLHITLGIHRPTRHGILEALVGLAASHQPLRGGLPLGVDVSDPAQVAPHLATTIAALRDWLVTVDPASVARTLRTPQWTASRPGPVRPIAQLAYAQRLSSQNTVVLRPGLRCTFDGTRLELPDRVLTFPAACSQAVSLILEGRPVRVGELPGLDDPSRLVLARRLLREAVAVPDVYDPPPRGR